MDAKHKEMLFHHTILLQESLIQINADIAPVPNGGLWRGNFISCEDVSFGNCAESTYSYNIVWNYAPIPEAHLIDKTLSESVQLQLSSSSS